MTKPTPQGGKPTPADDPERATADKPVPADDPTTDGGKPTPAGEPGK